MAFCKARRVYNAFWNAHLCASVRATCRWSLIWCSLFLSCANRRILWKCNCIFQLCACYIKLSFLYRLYIIRFMSTPPCRTLLYSLSNGSIMGYDVKTGENRIVTSSYDVWAYGLCVNDQVSEQSSYCTSLFKWFSWDDAVIYSGYHIILIFPGDWTWVIVKFYKDDDFPRYCTYTTAGFWSLMIWKLTPIH